ncbi:hypothetical protein BY996DRAFT_6475111 [Phakopsora pachyrhizi]|nr:hypothetical protein BY996DRAFT_6475111 [Phakopsora pachyrhizi]
MISQKLNLMFSCYEQMDQIFGSLLNVNHLGGGDPKRHTWALPQTPNESTDEYTLTNLGEATLTPVIDEQLFRFPKEYKDIREGEDISPITNLDIITNEIPVPPLATPINTSTSQKTSNSWNLNPNSHQKTSKSPPPPTTYSELYEAKTDCESDYESGSISREWEKWSLEGELQMKQEETTKDLEYQKLHHSKECKTILNGAELADLRLISLIDDGASVGMNYAMMHFNKKLKPSRSDAGLGFKTHVFYNVGASSIKSTGIKFSMFEEKIHSSSKIKKNVTMLDVKGFGFEKGPDGLTFDLKIRDHLKQEFETQTKLDITNRVKQIEGLVDDHNFKIVLSRQTFEEYFSSNVSKFTQPIIDSLKTLFSARISGKFKTKDIRIKNISPHSLSATYNITRLRANPYHGKTQAQEINTLCTILKTLFEESFPDSLLNFNIHGIASALADHTNVTGQEDSARNASIKLAVQLDKSALVLVSGATLNFSSKVSQSNGDESIANKIARFFESNNKKERGSEEEQTEEISAEDDSINPLAPQKKKRKKKDK